MPPGIVFAKIPGLHACAEDLFIKFRLIRRENRPLSVISPSYKQAFGIFYTGFINNCLNILFRGLQ